MRWPILAATVLLVLVGFASVGRAEEPDEPRWYFGTRFGHGLMLNRRPAPGVQVSSGAPATGVFGGLNLNRYLGIELAAEFFEIGLMVPGRGRSANTACSP